MLFNSFPIAISEVRFEFQNQLSTPSIQDTQLCKSNTPLNVESGNPLSICNWISAIELSSKLAAFRGFVGQREEPVLEWLNKPLKRETQTRAESREYTIRLGKASGLAWTLPGLTPITLPLSFSLSFYPLSICPLPPPLPYPILPSPSILFLQKLQ